MGQHPSRTDESGGLDLAHILVGFFAPGVGVILMAVAGPLYLLWFPLVGRRQYQLGRAEEAADFQRSTRREP